jgi:hypothetical protein
MGSTLLTSWKDMFGGFGKGTSAAPASALTLAI